MKFLKISLVFLISYNIFSASGFAANWASSWESIQSHGEAVTSIASDFVQEKHLPILIRPLVSKGAFYYQQPGFLRWEYKSPVKSILLMNQGDAKRFLGSDTGYVEDQGAGMDAMGFIMPEITSWMKGRFNDNPMFDAQLEPDDKIVLVPKEKSFAGLIHKIELILSKQPGVIQSVVIYESPDAFTRLVFVNPSLNRNIPDETFKRP